uniref:Translocator protein n=1 Tax=Clastoptera arizonana TaxID=38151 RepID=A0A1B6CFI1_9HEMI
MYDIWPVVGAVALPNIGGFLSGYFVGRENYTTWYESLKKPDWRPPKSAFPIVWTSLYSGMGYASYLVWRDGGGFNGSGKMPLILYGTQLALNFAWSPIFFRLHSLSGGLVDIVLLIGANVATAYTFHQINHVAGYLLIPYLAWLGLAGALNYSIWRDNKPGGATITEVKGQ